jgi:hypothetical protein
MFGLVVALRIAPYPFACTIISEAKIRRAGYDAVNGLVSQGNVPGVGIGK